jgi:ferredoxin-type protein NapF
VEACTQCGDCIEACPEKILTTGDGQYPVTDFGRGECTFCGDCAVVCAEGAFVPQSSQPWTIRANIKDVCLSRRGITCRTCGDICEPRAITFELKLGGVANPSVDPEKCTGCGACYHPCPVDAIQLSDQTGEPTKAQFAAATERPSP